MVKYKLILWYWFLFRYANRAKNIINKPTVNEDANVKLIRDLRAEIERLKAIMSGDPLILASVQEQLAAKEAKEQKLTAEWNEKWREAAKILQEHFWHIIIRLLYAFLCFKGKNINPLVHNSIHGYYFMSRL